MFRRQSRPWVRPGDREFLIELRDHPVSPVGAVKGCAE